MAESLGAVRKNHQQGMWGKMTVFHSRMFYPHFSTHSPHFYVENMSWDDEDPPRNLFIPGVDIGGDVFHNFCLFWVGLHQVFNAVQSVEDGAVVSSVELLTDLL